jgi:small subunit ribosomal protein S1
VSRISHPEERISPSDFIFTVVKSIDENGRITLSHKELLGTWEQNAAGLKVGETVPGIVRSVEKYGIFVELAPNLAGLAEFSEGVEAGCHAGVYIKSIIPSKMKIKLIIVDSFDADYPVQPPEYFIKDGHIDSWNYSPTGSDKIIETVF